MPRDPAKVREYNRRYREKNRVKLRCNRLVWEEKNRDAMKEYQREYRATRREALNAKKRLEHYNLTQVELDTMLAAQCDKCVICNLPPGGKGPNAVLHIDHDHETGEVRGLLCQACNRGLGFFRDDPERLAAAIEYLVIR
jgi:hypothetical protein